MLWAEWAMKVIENIRVVGLKAVNMDKSYSLPPFQV